MGGLEAMGPVGRSITRSGVVFEVLEDGLGVVLLPQLWPVLSPSLGLLILRLSQRSFLRRKLFPELEVPALSPGVSADDDDDGVTGASGVFLAPAPATQRLLPQLDCLSSTLPDSDTSDIFLVAGMIGDDVVDILGRAPSSRLSVIRDCLCSGTGGEDDLEDFLRSGVSCLVTVETLL